MGYMRHHMIVVTSWDKELILDAHLKAQEIFKHEITNVLISPINFYYSFFIPPDGSKEGWSESDQGDENRERFIKWLNSKRYSDNSSPFDWAEVQYGDDEKETKIVRHNDELPER